MNAPAGEARHRQRDGRAHRGGCRSARARTGEQLGIADFGAADGGTSKQAIDQIVAALRARFPSPLITVTYNDLPGNDYSTLFRNITGLSGFIEHNYLDDFDNVLVNACGTGFHRQLLPDAS